MLILQVSLHVKPEQIESFKQISIENAQSSLREPGIVRFDILQQEDDPSRFIFVEVYRTAEDNALHRDTPHYKKWAELAPPMLVEPRTRTRYTNLFPDNTGWQ